MDERSASVMGTVLDLFASRRRVFPSVVAVLVVALVPGPGFAQSGRTDASLVTGSSTERLRSLAESCQAADWTSVGMALADPDPWIRQMAVGCWDTTHESIDPLAGLIEDPEARVRSAVALALGRSSDPRAHGWLTHLLDDPVDRVRASAVEAIGERGEAPTTAELSGLLFDPSAIVCASVAELLTRHPPDERLDPAQQEAMESGRILARMGADSPPLLGLVNSIERRMDRLESDLDSSPRAQTFCGRATSTALSSARGELDRLLFDSGRSKPDGLFEDLRQTRQRLDGIEQAYLDCAEVEPVTLDSAGGGRHVVGRLLVALAELTTAWEKGFGQLRPEIGENPERGDLWAQSLFSLGLFLPGRPEGTAAPVDRPSLAALAQLTRDQFFRQDPLSAFSPAGYARGRLPVACSWFEDCLAVLTVHGRRAPGSLSDHPSTLVARSSRLGADLSFLMWGDRLSGAAGLAWSGVRYEAEAFEPAGLDRLVGRVTVDTPLILEVAVVRNLYAAEGAAFTPVPEGSSLVERNSFLLESSAGIQIGDPGDNDILQLTVKGGISAPFLDDPDIAVDPDLTFDIRLDLQNREEQGSARFVRLSIGGLRRNEASPRDFALQTYTRSYLDFVYRGMDPPRSGIQIHGELFYDLTDHHVPIVQQDSFEILRVGGGASLRILVDRWIGFEIANWTTAIAEQAADFEVNNRFQLSLFLPLGGHGFGIEEPLPW